MDHDKWWTKYHHEAESSVPPALVQSRGCCGHDDDDNETEMKRNGRDTTRYERDSYDSEWEQDVFDSGSWLEPKLPRGTIHVSNAPSGTDTVFGLFRILLLEWFLLTTTTTTIALSCSNRCGSFYLGSFSACCHLYMLRELVGC